MARKRVIAYAMHETEIGAAKNTMQPISVTESFVVGDADDAEIAAMQQQGLIVEVVGDPTAEQLEGTTAAEGPAPGGAAPSFGVGAGPPPPPPPPGPIGQPDYYLLWINGPMLKEWQDQLDAMGLTLLERYPSGATKVQLRPDQVGLVNGLPFVRQLRRVDASDAGPPRAFSMRAADAIGSTGRRMLTFDIRLNQPADAPVVKDWLTAQNVPIAGANDRKIRVFLLEDTDKVEEIRALPGVAFCDEYVPPKLHNDLARRLISVDANPAGVLIDETGDGQIVAVADTGIDDTHPDFAGRIVGKVALGRPTSDDPHGHGTHVAGSVLGDGSASGGQYKGVAHKAQLFFQSLLDAQGGLGGLPFDLGDLFEEAYVAGARVHNNSWGSATESKYTVSSTEVDDFVAKRRDMLIVISAGNEGTAAIARAAAPGFVDWLSIGSPASCKNALTVGASRSDRTSEGLSSMTYGEAWPAAYPNPPIASEKVSGDPQCLAAFSSRGPCDDRRIKPDVVAPGTDIASTKSSTAPLRKFWGAVGGNPQYAYMGGTSMSAPLVAGCAALVREYYIKKHNHSPSAALVKATLINGTTWLTGVDSLAPDAGVPNYHQGFGRVDMARALPNAGEPAKSLHFVDDWQPGAGFTASGQRRRYHLTLGADSPSLRICLAYTDHPARALQNNLNLIVQLPDASKVMGNAQLPNSLRIPDPDNNVEIVRIDNAVAGTYLIQVSASNLLKPPQDFALVATGENVTSFVQI